jgi:DNA repair protein RadC
VVERALRILEDRVREPGPLMTKRSFVAEWFRLRLGLHEREVFAVAWLDVRHRLIEFRELFAGTIDRTEVHLREVVKSALACNAAAAIFAHNHPSGYAEPSQLDIELTEYLQVNLGALGVAVLDHLVVTTRSAVSVYGSPLRIKALHRLSPPISGAETSGPKPGRTARKRDE